MRKGVTAMVWQCNSKMVLWFRILTILIICRALLIGQQLLCFSVFAVMPMRPNWLMKCWSIIRGQAACIFKLPPCSGIFIDAHRPNGSFEKCSNFTDLHLNGRDYDKLKRLAAICGYKMRLCSFSLVARNLCLMRHNKILCQLPKAHKSTNFASFGPIFAETFVMFGIMSLPR